MTSFNELKLFSNLRDIRMDLHSQLNDMIQRNLLGACREDVWLSIALPIWNKNTTVETSATTKLKEFSL